MTKRYDALINQAAHALKDSTEKDTGALMREAAALAHGDPWVAMKSLRDDVSARLDDLARLTGVEIGRLIDAIQRTAKSK
jgi:hypothetical protein